MQLMGVHGFLARASGLLSVAMRAAACRSCRLFLTSDEQGERIRAKQRAEGSIQLGLGVRAGVRIQVRAREGCGHGLSPSTIRAKT